jgi:hypothetical protein
MSSQSEVNATRIVAAVRRLGKSSLFGRDTPVKNTKEAIGWWETRRASYNLIVGGTGIITCAVILIIGAAASIFFNSDFGLPDPPLFAIFGVIVYGVMANVCFTGGWVTELIVRRVWADEADRFATSAFSLGLAFSVLLTLIPAIIVGVIGFFLLVRHILVRGHT